MWTECPVGRLGPGLCLRLWGEGALMQDAPRPEMLDADLAPLALALALRDDGRPDRPHPRCAQEPGPDIGSVPPSWGTLDGRSPGGDLRWLDAPPAEALAAARALLRSLGAINAAGMATPVGVWPWPSRDSGGQAGRRWPGRVALATIHLPCPCVEIGADVERQPTSRFSCVLR